MSTTENGQPLGLGLGEGLGPLRPLLTADDERGHFAEWIATALPFGAGNNMAEHAAKTDAAWLGWMARAGLEAFRCNEVLQQERQSLAMMLRMCASRLRNHGHQDLGDKAVDLLIRFGLQGSPLRAEPQKLPILPPSTELEKLAEEAGMVNLLNHGAASCVYSEGCHGVTQEHLERFAELVRIASDTLRCADRDSPGRLTQHDLRQ